MKPYYISLISFCLFNFSFCKSFGQVVSKIDKNSIELRVMLLASDDNTPIPEARVYAEGNTFAGLYSGTTDQEGVAVILVYRGGDVVVTADHPQFNPVTQTIKINKYGDQKSYTLNLRLKRKNPADKVSNNLYVSVKDKSNKPIPGASIVVLPGVSAVTNSQGFCKNYFFISEYVGEP